MPYDRDQEFYLEVELYRVRETDKAYLFRDELTPKGRNFWVAKSKCRDVEMRKEKATGRWIAKLEIPQWIAEQEGLMVDG